MFTNFDYRRLKRVGNRLFAVPKVMTISDRIAAASARGITRKVPWSRVDAVKGRARVIVNATGRAMPRRQPRFGA